MVCSGYVRSVLCSVRGPGSVLCSSFSRGSYPTVWYASLSKFTLVTRGAFLPISAARASRASLPCLHLLVADAGVCAAFPPGELLLGYSPRGHKESDTT